MLCASRRSTTLPLGWSPRGSSNRRSGEYETQILSCLGFSRIYNPMGAIQAARRSGGELLRPGRGDRSTFACAVPDPLGAAAPLPAALVRRGNRRLFHRTGTATGRHPPTSAARRSRDGEQRPSYSRAMRPGASREHRRAAGAAAQGLTSCGRARCGGSHAHAHPNRLPQLRAYRRRHRRVKSTRHRALWVRPVPRRF
jgi:hypothetical protein